MNHQTQSQEIDMNRKTCFASLSFAALLLAGAAHAQTMLGGGKGATTFPIVINQSGSYKLAGNLVVPAGSNGIVVGNGLNVTLDLGGFQISGPMQCSKAGCDANLQTTGIKVGESSLRVFGGAVRGFGTGIGMDNAAPLSKVVLEDVVASRNFNGIFLIVLQASRVTVEHNAFYGLSANRGTVVDTLALRNGGTGIGMGLGIVRSSASHENGKYGFEITGGVYDLLTSNLNGMGNQLVGTAGLNNFY
jgi:hypothetical protein